MSSKRRKSYCHVVSQFTTNVRKIFFACNSAFYKVIVHVKSKRNTFTYILSNLLVAVLVSAKD